jgi:hypothetical protein
VASSPQNRSPSISTVGTPNTPAALACSVFARSFALGLGAAIAAAASAMPKRAATGASASAVVAREAVAPDVVVDRGDRLRRRARREAEPERGERVERMRRGKSERYAVAPARHCTKR